MTLKLTKEDVSLEKMKTDGIKLELIDNMVFEILSLLKTVIAPLRLRISLIVFSICENNLKNDLIYSFL